jgi:CheY-like chemotaxis protein
METTAARPMRVMVVDDDVDTVNSTAMLLRLDGHEVITTGSGMDALALAPIFRPEIVLLDLAMPEQNGLAVAQRIQRLALPRRPYLVAVTGHGTKDDKRRSAQVGFDLHLTKPVGHKTYQGLVTLLQLSRPTTERSRTLTAQHRAIGTELILAQLEMANIYLDTAAIDTIPDGMRISYIAHASRAHERISTWLFSGACADEHAGVVLDALRRLKDRISRKRSPAKSE